MDELGVSPKDALGHAARFGRDRCRTPMQWANAPNGGFSPAGVQTWLPVNANYARGVNVAEQRDDPESLLNFYRRLLRVRKETPALAAGDYTPLHEDAEEYFAFLRGSPDDGQTCVVVLNMSARVHSLNFGSEIGFVLRPETDSARLIFSSRARGGETDHLSEVTIAPFEVYIAELR